MRGWPCPTLESIRFNQVRQLHPATASDLFQGEPECILKRHTRGCDRQSRLSARTTVGDLIMPAPNAQAILTEVRPFWPAVPVRCHSVRPFHIQRTRPFQLELEPSRIDRVMCWIITFRLLRQRKWSILQNPGALKEYLVAMPYAMPAAGPSRTYTGKRKLALLVIRRWKRRRR